MSAQQQPAQSLTDAAALLSSILASAETIRTLSNVATTGPQTTVGAASGNTLDGQLSSLFPCRERLCTPLSSTTLLWHMDIWLEEKKN
ncbi:hypothetical protein KUCAC02_013791 [Chaenocephalus aceratus]|uniref:Uncharacterized protein n=1 Tax=Chaenocephalus aceratus TaxID=36190 RepID=A0ACB9WC36_CHAAC|nr:hypothetical protein KUCAC02_013791 [Chaenocephalus aceratus]